MQFWKPSLFALMLLVACDGNPFTGDPDGGGDGDGDGDSTFPLDGTTTNPSPNSAIQRVENRDEASGNGFAEDFAYNPRNDTFFVDGLAFDGDNVYRRDNAVGTLANGSVDVFEGDATAIDPVTGAVIVQDQYRALYGVSDSGQTEFAIVRTGSYVDYGFGGFVYQRNGSVTLPTSGQYHFSGEYAGIRDFSGAGGLEYTDGLMTIDIDFEDFNDGANGAGDGIKGEITDRHVYDINGNDITDDILTALNGDDGTMTVLPTLSFAVGPEVLDQNGEITSNISSTVNVDGALTVYEEGTFYAVVAGEAEEIVGIVVIESTDPRVESGGVTVRETGGFIVYHE